MNQKLRIFVHGKHYHFVLTSNGLGKPIKYAFQVYQYVQMCCVFLVIVCYQVRKENRIT